ncbi:asparagine synthase-related protein [Phytoactinopolyspora halotolerans]|uniref:Asparagine synthetase domain-containing protein n=1 Tax=Phytoactinopolyspora halotolerans TaxID=1981512 RepID=A0A6L9SHH4_9ACTN|nr:asparagine synthase-related protein [Phytoactinopolyspora halotolerans]NEE04088.1 hypothetical protein [Phytoactinopolyspora halotolerans]
MSDQLGGVRSLLDTPDGALRADAGAVRWSRQQGAAISWSPVPLPETVGETADEAALRHDAFTLVIDDGSGHLHSGVSGAVPIYVDGAGPATGAGSGADTAVHFCSRVEPLARTRAGGLRPDWDAWAHILAAGAPLEGRTTFEGIRRLQPWSRVTADRSGRAELTAAGWPWLEGHEVGAAGAGGSGLEAVRAALLASVTELGGRVALNPLLSGGWDSRILATLAARASARPVTAWTTSSDTGTVMEELVAAKVAAQLGARHELVPPRWDGFADDLAMFARSVDYQTSFHVWLVPLARALVGTSGAVLDGLGGGLFVGGAFPDDDTDRPVLDKRFDLLARYLNGAEAVLDPRVVAQLTERTRASFESVAKPLVDHPFGSTFTAYLTRTLPGISLAPYGLMASSAPVATPFLDNDVVRAALAIPPAEHADGRLYPELLRGIDAELAQSPTALDLTPRPRRHPRRVASVEAASHVRGLLTREPVRRLLAPGLAEADLDVWQGLLNQTRAQHLIRGLATLALWLEEYDDVLGGVGVDELLEGTR